MEHFSLLNFILISIPEEFCMVLFAWAVLGKKDSVKFFNVIIAAITTAVSFEFLRITFYSDVLLRTVLQLLMLIVILCLIYRLNHIEAIIGSLLTALVTMAIQIVIHGSMYVIIGKKFGEIGSSSIIKYLVPIIELGILALLSYLICKKKNRIFDFRSEKLNGTNSEKMRFIFLQLIFTFLLTLTDYKIFVYKAFYNTTAEKLLVIMNFLLIGIFTAIVVKSAFKMGKSIQDEEEQKRKMDGREILQNIDYMCKLMDEKQYAEVNNILNLMKNDVNNGIINNKTNREVSVEHIKK